MIVFFNLIRDFFKQDEKKFNNQGNVRTNDKTKIKCLIVRKKGEEININIRIEYWWQKYVGKMKFNYERMNVGIVIKKQNENE